MSVIASRRLAVLKVAVIAILLTLLGRLAYMQGFEADRYRAAASDNRVRDIVENAARGQILDDRGVALVANRLALVVSVARSQLPSERAARDVELSRLSRVVGIPVADIERITT